tara:strand:- start:27116 stop:28309 length:1194 start_codon:yes stop_codon:yes gene_type:complete
MKFEDFKLSKGILDDIKSLGIKEPTLIQERSIPLIIEGKDVIGESATGSGKTLAFGSGIVESTNLGKGMQSLVITPTRELADQVRDSLRQLSKHKRLNIISVYGGVDINKQIKDIPKADGIVGTPGRLLDHLQRRTINLSKIKILVLDECDRMFDMGFKEDIEKIIKQCQRDRQSLFFSATISPQIKKLAHNYMKNPIKVTATAMVDPAKLKQIYYNIDNGKKMSLLVNLLKHERSKLVMVFCNTRRMTDLVVKNLSANKINAIAIHGGLSQNKRNRTLGLFNGAKTDVLVCTDVAARGLHIENVSHIYNYDIPANPKDYVHRIGRTARVGKEGIVINILTTGDHSNFSNLLREYPNFKIQKMNMIALEDIKFMKEESRRRPMMHRGRKPRMHQRRR